MSSKRAAFYSTEGVLALECKDFKSDSAITILSKLKGFLPAILNGKVYQIFYFYRMCGFSSLQGSLDADNE